MVFWWRTASIDCSNRVAPRGIKSETLSGWLSNADPTQGSYPMNLSPTFFNTTREGLIRKTDSLRSEMDKAHIGFFVSRSITFTTSTSVPATLISAPQSRYYLPLPCNRKRSEFP